MTATSNGGCFLLSVCVGGIVRGEVSDMGVGWGGGGVGWVCGVGWLWGCGGGGCFVCCLFVVRPRWFLFGVDSRREGQPG